tara:strand:+ start:430 stop:603 length:174 start_codon:yes stop_codon:yes gene_type:complete
MKRLLNNRLGLAGFWRTHKTIRGYEAMYMLSKGQVKLLDDTHMAEVKFIEEIFGLAA